MRPSPTTLLVAACPAMAVTAGAVGAGTAVAEDGSRTPSRGVSFYADDHVSAPSTDPNAQRSVGSSSSAATTPYPLSSTFALHSLPGSKRTIFLDFDGTAVAPDSWSVHHLGMAAKSYVGFNLQGDAGFTDYEKAFIQQVYRRVAEMYSPFDVDVTTQDPGTAAITRSSASDDTYGVQVAITSSTTAFKTICSTCSGVAPIGSFNEPESSPGEYQPAWVFTANTYPDTYLNSASLTADSVAHEVGHTFGLMHDATSSNPDYYAGHANWFPIMGQSAGNTSVGQWSKGEYAGANNREDDIAIIAANGAPLRSDDWGGIANPTSLGTRKSYVVKGLINSDADYDVFTIDRGCTGPMMVNATGIGAGATVDLRLDVLDATGKVVASSNPASNQTQVYPERWYRATGMDAAVSLRSAPGTRFTLRVTGVGSLNPLDTGYSGYGSIGQYTLTVSSCSTPLPTVTKPGRPAIRSVAAGPAGGPLTLTPTWTAPSNGGSAITGYKIQAVKVNSRGAVVRTYTLKAAGSARSLKITMPAGRYKIRIAATNKVGTGVYSAYSSPIAAR